MSTATHDHLLSDNAKELTSLSGKDFEAMIQPVNKGELVLTLRLPMERKGSETRKNHIRFKNALQEAEALLESHSGDHKELAETLTLLSGHAEEGDDFWQHQDAGLAITITASGTIRSFKVPFSLDQTVTLDDTAHLTPLLRLLDPTMVSVLALDLGKTELFEASPWSFRRLDMGDMPESLDEAMKYDDPEKSLQHRSVGGNNTAYHGHFISGDEEHNKKIQRFFEMIDHELPNQLPDPNRPSFFLAPSQRPDFSAKSPTSIISSMRRLTSIPAT
jgi:hypothetical protein